jgi:3-hydroxyisobutyrate dehydrogenase-like beta-hydroxyacid dehydrogenase
VTAVAVVGLGLMGRGIAARLLATGHAVTVWSRSADPAPLLAAGATGAGSAAAAAAGAGVVLTMVTADEALAAVTEGPAGVLAGLGDGGVLLQCSTVSPAAVRRLAAALPAGTDLVDAPVLGSVDMVPTGGLTVLAGGADPAIERCTGVLAALGTVARLGPAGAGTAAKIVVNSALFGMLGVLGESLALARALGLPADRAYQALGLSPLGAQAERRRPSIERDAYPARFRLELAGKDADLALAAAAEQGVDLRLAPAVRSWFSSAQDAGWAGEDYTAILRAILAGSR